MMNNAYSFVEAKYNRQIHDTLVESFIFGIELLMSFFDPHRVVYELYFALAASTRNVSRLPATPPPQCLSESHTQIRGRGAKPPFSERLSLKREKASQETGV